MAKERIILLGSGGHAMIVLDILEEMRKFDIIGVVTKDALNNKTFMGYKILGNDDVLSELYQQGIKKIAIGIGGFKNNSLRKKVFLKIKKMGFHAITAIHPRAIISKTVNIGEGSVIFPGVVINSSTKIGDNVIIATGSTVDHNTIIGNHVLISAGVTVGADNIINEEALLALGSKVVSGITIGSDVLIGAGAVVVKDCLTPGIYLGIPARKVTRKVK